MIGDMLSLPLKQVFIDLIFMFVIFQCFYCLMFNVCIFQLWYGSSDPMKIITLGNVGIFLCGFQR